MESKKSSPIPVVSPDANGLGEPSSGVIVAAFNILQTKPLSDEKCAELVEKLSRGFGELHPGLRPKQGDAYAPYTVEFLFTAHSLSQDVLRIMTAEQKAWLLDDALYLQLSLIGPPVAERDFELFDPYTEHLADKGALQMLWFDTLYSFMNPRPRPEDFADLMHFVSNEISDETREGLLQMRPEIMLDEMLSHLRTNLLVQGRAILEGLDPKFTLRKFHDARGEYFLDYSRAAASRKEGLK